MRAEMGGLHQFVVDAHSQTSNDGQIVLEA